MTTNDVVDPRTLRARVPLLLRSLSRFLSLFLTDSLSRFLSMSLYVLLFHSHVACCGCPVRVFNHGVPPTSHQSTPNRTGRKYLRGPRGVGFLYVRRELLTPLLEPPTIDHYAAPWTAPDQYTLRPDAKRFENWENNYAAKVNLLLAAAGGATPSIQPPGINSLEQP